MEVQGPARKPALLKLQMGDVEGHACWLISCVDLAGPQGLDTCSNILGVSVREFLDEMNIYFGGLE